MRYRAWLIGALVLLAGLGLTRLTGMDPAQSHAPQGTLPTTETPTTTEIPPSSTTTPTSAMTATRTVIPACGSPWSIVPSPNIGLGSNRLTGVAAVAPDDIWAVGYYTSTAGVERTLVEHWNGTGWTIIASLNQGAGSNLLNGVVAIAANDIWAVGYFIHPGEREHRTLTLHWDGSHWNLVPSPGQGALQAVAATGPSDVWAVGNLGTFDTQQNCCVQTLVEHWNGSAWQIVSSPSPDPNRSFLFGVAARTPTDVWAVGEYYAYQRTLVEHWDGTTWQVIASPNPYWTGNRLFNVVALTADDVWAIGACCWQPQETSSLHWDGAQWTEVPTPRFGYGTNELYAVAALGANDLWAGGHHLYGLLLEHWDGTTWQIAATPPNSLDRIVKSFAMLATNDIWAVGYNGRGLESLKQTLILHYAGPCASATPTPTVCPVQFSDVPTSDPFYPSIRCLACRGVVSGYADGTFRPGNNVTRGQVSKIVAAAAALSDPVPATQQTFSDVPPSNPFWLFIERLAGRGVISGYGCGGPGEPCDPANRPYFRWGNSLTRGQLAKIAANTVPWADAIPTSQQTFAEVPPTQPFWLYIERVLAHGVVSGYTCGGPGEPCDSANRPYYRPGALITRAQTAKIVANTFFPGCQTP